MTIGATGRWTMKRKILLACQTIEKEVLSINEEINFQGTIHFMPKNLHTDPKKLKAYLQDFIDSTYNVDEFLICTGSCGGGTENLKATNGRVIIPKAGDCLDLLLSSDKKSPRSMSSMFFTKSWVDYIKDSPLDFLKKVEEVGEDQAVQFVRKIYASIDAINIIDTGTYDLEEVTSYLEPLVEATDLELNILKGQCRLIKKLMTGPYDQDFIVIEKNEEGKWKEETF